MKIIDKTLRITVLAGFFLAFHLNASAQCHGSGGEGNNNSHAGHNSNAAKPNKDAKKSYSCPMHPEIVSPITGKCSKCGMALEQQKISAKEKQETMTYFSCTSHPLITSDKKGKCPVCNKKLKKIKVYSYE